MKIIGNKFERVGTVARLPESLMKDLTFSNNDLIDVGIVFDTVEIRVKVPNEISEHILEVYRAELAAGKDAEQAAVVAGSRKRVQKFLKEHGFDTANLAVGAAQLVQAVLSSIGG